MEPFQHVGALTQISAVELALAIAVIVLSLVAGAASFLWTRWMTRQENRLDDVEKRLWAIVERVSTKDDLREAIRHLDDRLDRLESRIDLAASQGAVR